MRLALVIVIVTAGCYSPSYRDCEITCVSGACPSGLSCREGVCRAGGQMQSCAEILGDANLDRDSGSLVDALADGSPNIDTDMDGHNDSIDNCRFIFNADQVNEDSDMFGDVCDPCPPFSTYLAGGNLQDANADLDLDGVGAGCDPNPMMNGDRLAFFFGFSNALPTGTMMNGPWTFSNGGAEINSPAGALSNLSFAVTPPVMPGHSDTVSTSASLIAYSGGANQMIKGMGVIDSIDAAGGNGIACVVGRNQNQFESLMVVPTADAFAIFGEGPTPGLAPPFTTLLAIVRLQGSSNFQCRMPNHPIVSGSFGTTPMTGPVGLHVRNATARFDWIMVVESPVTPP